MNGQKQEILIKLKSAGVKPKFNTFGKYIPITEESEFDYLLNHYKPSRAEWRKVKTESDPGRAGIKRTYTPESYNKIKVVK